MTLVSGDLSTTGTRKKNGSDEITFKGYNGNANHGNNNGIAINEILDGKTIRNDKLDKYQQNYNHNLNHQPHHQTSSKVSPSSQLQKPSQQLNQPNDTHQRQLHDDTAVVSDHKNDLQSCAPASTNNNNANPLHSSDSSRAHWGSKWEFLLSCVGLSVGIGNVWRFPYLAYENGGGAFLIPYLIMLTLVGKPMYFMELVIGQFASKGPTSIWSCCPMAKGVGAAMVAVCLVVCIFYNVVLAYAVYFIGSVFRYGLPWTSCDYDWAIGTNCQVRSENYTFIEGSKSSSQIFWENKVLESTDSIENLGGIKWDLALCLAISWLITLLCLIKGVKTSGKVVYFAATFPYVILISLLLVGFTRTGSWEGVKYFITPSWDKLLSIQVWLAAASQMFFSLGVSMGALIMYSSYNDFRHNVFRDAMVVSAMDTLTSIIAGLVIFSVLGALAHELGVEVKDVVKSGPGLAFVIYPEALSRLPMPELWSVAFFAMLFILGLDSEFALLECVITSLSDEFQFVRRNRVKCCFAVGVFCFLVGLTCVTRGGKYVFEILDYYGGGLPLVYIAVVECIAIMWVYGFKNFAYDIQYMLGRRVGWYWKITWAWTSPLVLAFIAGYSLLTHKSLKLGDYDFPVWADVVGWGVTLAILGQIPLWAIVSIIKEKRGEGLLEKIKASSKDTDKWGPQNPETKKDWKSKKNGLGSVFMGVKSEFYDKKESAKLKGFTMNGVS